jgi:phage terminase small subunit
MARKRKGRRSITGRKVQLDPNALTPQNEAFIAEYLANRGNATQAYRKVYRNVANDNSAAASACALLRKPKIASRIAELRAEQFKALHMSGAEVLALIACDARADPTTLYDDKGQLLAMAKWPEEIRRSIRSIKPGPFGDTIVLNDSLRARQILGEQTGVLKQPLGAFNDLARLLTGLDDEEP